jgi:ribonuclease D
MTIHPITSTSALKDVCARMKKSEYIAIDTEFLRKTTYYAKLCLVQIADENEAHIIDPLAEGIELEAFYDLMDGGPMKVIHAARQDLEIFLHADGRLPNPIFDTQVAAMVCGYGDSVGYETLAKSIAGQTVDKSARFTDWSRRPLSDKQLAYALSDVTHLRTIYKTLAAKLKQSNRMDWLEQEEEALTNPATYRVEPENAWKRLKCKSSNRRFLGMVRALAAWREENAQSKDVPRNRIIRDEILFEIAAHRPASAGDLQKIRGIPKRYMDKTGAQPIIELCKYVEQMPDAQLPDANNTKNSHFEKAGPALDLVKVLLKIRCKETGVAAKLVASAAQLDQMARGERNNLPFLHGWRYELFGRDAERLLNGEVSLSVHGKRIRLNELDQK